MRRLAFLALTLATGCSDALEQKSSAGQVIGVVNASDRTLSVISATDFSVSTHDWQSGTASPRTIDGRGHVFVVPLGAADAVGISRFFTCPPGALACGRPDYVLPLAPRSGATPAGPSWLTSFECCSVRTPDSIPLTGTNARFATVGDDSLLYVIASGHAGAADGKLSIVDPQARAEVAVLNGLGESPGAAAFHPAGSRLLVASATEGILEVNASIRVITRGPGNGVKPGGHGVSGLAIDLRGRVYAVDAASLATPEFCAVSGGVVHVLTAPPDYHEIHTATVGCGPTTAAVAATP